MTIISEFRVIDGNLWARIDTPDEPVGELIIWTATERDAALKQAADQARAEEREACAKVVERHKISEVFNWKAPIPLGLEFAAAIRARKEG